MSERLNQIEKNDIQRAIDVAAQKRTGVTMTAREAQSLFDEANEAETLRALVTAKESQ